MTRGTNPKSKLNKPRCSICMVNKQPHKNQLGSKMIEGEKIDMGKAKDMGVINQRKKRQEGKTPQKNVKPKNELM